MGMNNIIKIETIDEIAIAAERFLSKMGSRKVVAFFGEMGAGKTTFIKAICRALGVTEGVTSPTFTLVNEYKTLFGDSIYHFDFYRIDKLSEAFDIGIEEFLYSKNLCLIEWAEKIEAELPEETLCVQISVLEDGSRELKIEDSCLV